MTRRETRALVASLCYIALMALAQVVMLRVFNLHYGTPQMMYFLVFAEIILAIFALAAYFSLVRTKDPGRGRVFKFNSASVFADPDRKIHWLWWLPTWFVLAAMAYNIATTYNGQLAKANLLLIGVTVIGTLLVGISEEVMFRGVLLPVLLEKRGILVSLLVSAILFGLLHGVNILGGQSGPATVEQVISTTIMGLFYGALTIRCGTLHAAIITHFLWDCFIITGVEVGVNNLGLAGLGQIVEIVFVVPLTIVLIMRQLKTEKTVAPRRGYND